MEDYKQMKEDFRYVIRELAKIVSEDEQMNIKKRKIRMVYWTMVVIMVGLAAFCVKNLNLHQDRLYQKAISEYANGSLSSAEELFGKIDYKNSREWQEAINDQMAQLAYLSKDFDSARDYLSKGSKDADRGALRCFVHLCLGRASWREMDYEETLLHYSCVLEELDNLDKAAISQDRASKLEEECHYYIGKVMYNKGDYEAAVRELSVTSYSDADDVLKLSEDALKWSGTVLKAEPVDSEVLARYKRYVLDRSMIKESSYLVQHDGRRNPGWQGFDGNKNTNWQEGVKGPGYDEFVEADFGTPHSVSVISFKLGNWYQERLYEENNVPKELRLDIDGSTYTVGFPKERQEFAIFLPARVSISKIRFTIVSVYPGSLYDDTVITDIGFYEE